MVAAPIEEIQRQDDSVARLLGWPLFLQTRFRRAVALSNCACPMPWFLTLLNFSLSPLQKQYLLPAKRREVSLH